MDPQTTTFQPIKPSGASPLGQNISAQASSFGSLPQSGFQTSFIPKKNLVDTDQTRPVNKTAFALVIVSVFILIGAAALAALSYTYKKTKENTVAALEKKIEQKKKEYDPNLIADLKAYQVRSEAVAGILSNQVTVTPILESLSELTLKTVQFKDFSYKVGSDKTSGSLSPASSTGGSPVTVSLSGVAQSYKTIILQNEMLEKNSFFKNIIFSDIAPKEKTSNIGFKLSFDVDSVFVNYSRTLERRKEYQGTFGGRVLSVKEVSSDVKDLSLNVPEGQN